METKSCRFSLYDSHRLMSKAAAICADLLVMRCHAFRHLAQYAHIYHTMRLC